jgi:dTDP-4-dehydrorhamnose 3,5-epimerase
MEIVDFEARPGGIDGLWIIAVKQVTDERGTIREVFRRSALEAAGLSVPPFEQINVTETRAGAVRGMHAEQTTKLVTVAAGEVFAAFVDLRDDSPTFAGVETVVLRPGVQVLVPAGVANGFQGLSETSQYVYCFDREWQPGMPGRSITPLDAQLAIPWPMPIDTDDPARISAKDRDAPPLQDLRAREIDA